MHTTPPAQSRAAPDNPLDALLAQPERSGFFQAVRLLLRTHPLRGKNARIPENFLRFSSNIGLSFPPTEIAAIFRRPTDEPDGPRTMQVNFMGLAGISGTLPRHYTEWLIALRQARDPATQEFFDLFNHRLILLFWQAWARHRPEIAMETGANTGLQRHVFDLVGMGTPQLYQSLTLSGSPAPRSASGLRHTHQAMPGNALGYYSGLIAQRPHGAGSLAQILSDYLGAAVKVEACVGSWQDVPTQDQTRLGQAASSLGAQCLLGKRFWDRQSTLRLRVGPLLGAHFEALLPNTDGHTGLLDSAVELTRFMTGLALDLRIRLCVQANEVPVAKPRAYTPGGRQMMRLGWNTWLAGRRSALPADECEFQFSATGGQSWR